MIDISAPTLYHCDHKSFEESEEMAIVDLLEPDEDLVEQPHAEVLDGLSQSIPMVSLAFVSLPIENAEPSIDRLESLGHYEYNAIPVEKRRFLWEAWQTPDKMRGRLAHQAIKFPSGDLYARRISRLQDTTT